MKLRRKYFRILAISYLGILLIPLAIGSLSYVLSRQAMEAEIYRANLALVTQACTDLDRSMQQKDMLLSNISLNAQVNEFLSRRPPLMDNEHYLLYNISSAFSVLQNSYPFISEFYVYFPNSDILVAPGAVYAPSTYYEDAQALRQIDFNTWQAEYLCKAYRTSADFGYMSDRGTPSHLTYIQSLPLSLMNASSANIVVHVEKARIAEILSSLDMGAGCSYYLISGEQVLMHGGSALLPVLDYSERMVDGNGFLVVPGEGEQIALTYVASNQQNWRLVYAVPIGTYMQRVENIRYTTMQIFFIALLLGLVLVVTFTHRAYTPLRKITAILPSPQVAADERDEFGYIQSTLCNALEQDKRKEILLEKQRPLVRQHLLSRLVNGSLDFDAGTLELMDQVGIHLPCDGFVVCVLRAAQHYEAKDQVVLIPTVEELLPALERAIGGHAYAIEDNRGVIALILNLPYAENAPLESAVCDLSDALGEEMRSCFSVGIGRVGGSMTSIVRSFAQAMRALDYAAMAPESPVCCYDSIVRSDQHYYYPFEVEQQLASFLRAGLEEKAQRLIDYLFLENTEKRTLAPEVQNFFFINLVGTVLREASELRVANERILPGDQPLSEFMQNIADAQMARVCVGEMISRLCAAAEQDKNSKKKPLAEALVAFIQEHCRDASFGLQTCCDAFGLSPAYLSRFFKEQVGENFSSYLSELRIAIVKELLADYSLSMAEIAQMSGFTNMTTFARVFKKCVGLPPAAYRQQLLPQKTQEN